MYHYQEYGEYFIQIAHGVEELGIAEITPFGVEKCSPVYRGITFEANQETVYNIIYNSRLASRVLAPIRRFHCHEEDYLYKVASSIEWSDFLDPDRTFAIVTNLANSKIRNSQYITHILKDAIVDYFNDNCGKRPSVEKINPDVYIHLHIDKNQATISIEMSQGAMHRRGYRGQTGSAPMMETLVAAILQLTEWDGQTPLYDPFCGSGTFLAEALMLACKIPPAYLQQQFGLMNMPDYKATKWKQIRSMADQQIKELPKGLIAGSDIDPKAVAMAKKNLANLPGGSNIPIRICDFEKANVSEDAIIVANPPYGIRLGETAQMKILYKRIGDYLKHNRINTTAFLYLGDRELIPALFLRPRWKKQLFNGPLDGRLIRLDMY